MPIDPDLAKDLKKADLRYIHDTVIGITRARNHDSFHYFDTEKKRITSDVVITRIESLAIPPAWDNVWICSSPSGYIQATGFDEKGRKQYIYHADWIKLSQENKFKDIIFFGEVLPVIRKKVIRDMAREELERDKIVAAVIWLLEHTLIRIGNSEYAQENDSYGLTTLRNRHVTVKGKNVSFEFRGKSGVQHSVSISHPRIAKIIKECIELPGYEIFQYLDEGQMRHTVDSSDVNEYLKSLTGQEVTAKDFRTWGGSQLCATTLFTLGSAESATVCKKNITQAVKKVASHLRNTVSVCRNYYIHPVIISTYEKNLLIPHFENTYKSWTGKEDGLGREDFATLTLLRQYS